jgi:copper homeostasis protein (lipoprotein)
MEAEMRILNRFSLWATVALLATSMAHAKIVTLGAADNLTTVSLNLGDTLIVELPSGTVNGFQWNVHLPNPSALTQQNEEDVPAEDGGQRLHRFHFNAAIAGDVKLVIGFEGDVKIPGVRSADAAAFAITAHVDAGTARPGTAILIGIYKGTLPCADCSGLNTTLRLYARGLHDTTYAYFVRTQIYEGAPHGDVTLSDRGEWGVERGDSDDPDATVYRLNANQAERAEYLLVQDDGASLLQLDREAKKIDSKLNFTLIRIKTATAVH